jgi:hypothetical protein
MILLKLYLLDDEFWIKNWLYVINIIILQNKHLFISIYKIKGQ